MERFSAISHDWRGKMRNRFNRIFSLILALSLALGLLPAVSVSAAAGTAECREVFLGSGRIGNAKYSPTNLLRNFFNESVPGFTKTQPGSGEKFKYKVVSQILRGFTFAFCNS